MKGAPSGWADLSKKPARSPRSPAKHAVTCGASASPASDEGIRATREMALAIVREVSLGRLGPAHRASRVMRRKLAPWLLEAAGARLSFWFVRNRTTLREGRVLMCTHETGGAVYSPDNGVAVSSRLAAELTDHSCGRTRMACSPASRGPSGKLDAGRCVRRNLDKERSRTSR
jgi:hypothetical protein